jgi:outer membrane murein-binding lipoprotein Lpp
MHDAPEHPPWRALTVLTLSVALVVAACSSEPSMTDYAGDVESLVSTMNARIDRLAVEMEETKDMEEIKRLFEDRVQARYDFVEGLGALDPPADADDLHRAALGIVGRLADAEAALAASIPSTGTVNASDSIWETPEGLAARAADEEAIALCRAAEAELDATAYRSEFEGVPWIPSEMKEVVQVVFGCTADDR